MKRIVVILAVLLVSFSCFSAGAAREQHSANFLPDELTQAKPGDFLIEKDTGGLFVIEHVHGNKYEGFRFSWSGYLGHGWNATNAGDIGTIAPLISEVVLHKTEKERWVEVAEKYFGVPSE
jgi:hypothetical protein